MKFKNLFIITYGRTGSTLLMGLLNSYDEMKIKGENFNFVRGLYESYLRIVELKEKYGKKAQTITDPFYGAETTDIELYTKSIKKLIEEQLLTSEDKSIECWGFKEVRYTEKELTFDGKYDFKGYLDFIKLVFPEACFIFLYRDHLQVSQSAFWQTMQKNKIFSILKKTEDEMEGWALNRGDCFQLDYKDLVGKTSKLKEMHEFLDISYDAKHIDSVLAVEYSYANKKRPSTKEIKIDFIKSKQVAEIILDKVVINKFKQGVFTGVDLTGVVVLSPEYAMENYKIVVMADLSDTSECINWEIPSPYFEEKYSDNINAVNARFSGVVSFQKELKIFLESLELDRQLIVHIF